MKRLKLFGMTSVAVLACTGVAAASASAAHFNYNHSELTGTQPTTTAIVPGTTAVLSVPAIGLTLEGTGVESEGATIKPGGADSAESIVFTGVVLVGAEAICEVHSPGEPNGIVATNPVTTSLTESGTAIHDLFAPASGTTFVTVDIGGEECPLEEEAVISGKVAGNEVSPNTEALTQGLDFPSPALAESTLKYGSHEATLAVDTNITADAPFGAFAG